MNLPDAYLKESRVWVNPNAVAGLNSDGEVTDDQREMVLSYVVNGYNYAMKAYG